MFKKIKQFFKKRRNLKFDVTNLDKLLNEVSINEIKKLISDSNNFPPKGEFVIYTTYCGSTKNKTFNTRQVNSQIIPHYFISNNKDVLKLAEKKGWIPHYLNLPVYENVIFSAFQAKIAKALPHLFPIINQYNFSMYLDDKLDFNINLLPSFESLLKSNDSALAMREHNFLHPNVLSEFSEAMKHKRYFAQRQKSIKFITEQLQKGLRLDPREIYMTGAIFRDMQHPEVIRINEDWYQDILSCGTNCQISFDFLAQKYTTIAKLPQKID